MTIATQQATAMLVSAICAGGPEAHYVRLMDGMRELRTVTADQARVLLATGRYQASGSGRRVKKLRLGTPAPPPTWSRCWRTADAAVLAWEGRP